MVAVNCPDPRHPTRAVARAASIPDSLRPSQFWKPADVVTWPPQYSRNRRNWALLVYYVSWLLGLWTTADSENSRHRSQTGRSLVAVLHRSALSPGERARRGASPRRRTRRTLAGRSSSARTLSDSVSANKRDPPPSRPSLPPHVIPPPAAHPTAPLKHELYR